MDKHITIKTGMNFKPFLSSPVKIKPSTSEPRIVVTVKTMTEKNNTKVGSIFIVPIVIGRAVLTAC